MKYSCSKCVFAEMDGDKQSDCKINMLSHNKMDDYDDGYIMLKKICMGFRPKEWIEDYNITDPKVQVMKELKGACPVGYMVSFNKDLEAFKKTIRSLRNPKYLIVINEHEEYQPEIFEILKSVSCPYHHVLILESMNDLRRVDEGFRWCKNGWFTYVEAGYEFPDDYYDKIYNSFINKSDPLIAVSDEAHKKMLIFSKIYKYLGGSFPKRVEDNSIDSDNFWQRLEKSDKNIIKSWREVFE